MEREEGSNTGVYAFYLSALNLQAIGLDRGRDWSQIDLELAREKCLHIVQKMSRLILEPKRVEIEVRDTILYPEHQLKLKSSGFFQSDNFLENLVMSIELTDIFDFVRVLDHNPMLLPPIYIGVTQRTFRVRHEDHHRDFRARKKFGGRLHEFGFDWNEIVFSVMPLTPGQFKRTSYRNLEKLIQFCSRPVLGIK